MDAKNTLLSQLPKVDECINKVLPILDHTVPLRVVKNSIQKCIEIERQNILAGNKHYKSKSEQEWIELFHHEINKRLQPHFRRVINGTGIVIHTNLGRSLLAISAAASLAQAASHYTNLEYNLATGKRGSRYSLVEDILCELTGAEAALVVNNNAAAVLLVLDTLAKGKEAIVSRGQLVEIGGSFRIPDVMKKSGAKLVEVGSTNRTHLKDYEEAITEETALLLKVHTSNFRMIGFTSEVPMGDLVNLARKRSLLVMEDLGSGCFLDLSAYGLPKEPTVQEVVRAGTDVVTFSGDKLLGGPQAGIIVGKKETIEKIKKNPLNRALRIDKFTLASLENTLRNYYDRDLAIKNIPTLAMLTQPPEEIKKKAQKAFRKLKEKISAECDISLQPTASQVGGGAVPEYNLNSWAIGLRPKNFGLNTLEKKFRELEVPIIGRIENESFIIDFRTVLIHEIEELTTSIHNFFASETPNK